MGLACGELIKKRLKQEKFGIEEEFQRSFAPWNFVGELYRANESYGCALGLHNRMFMCRYHFGRRPVGSFGEQIKSEYMGSADQNLWLRQILSCNNFIDEDFALKS